MAVEVDKFEPESGEPGDRISVYGIGFSRIDVTTVIFFGDAIGLSVDVRSDDELFVTVPDTAKTGVIAVKVKNSVGRSSSPFTVLPLSPVKITNFLPKSGGKSQQVTIYGRGLTLGTNNRVYFGTVLATTVRWESETKIVANVPATAATGKVKIRVSNTEGTATSSADFVVK